MLGWLMEKFRKPVLPELPQILDTAEYEKLMPSVDSYPRPDWTKICQRIELEHGDKLDIVWRDFAHIWLKRLSFRLESGYVVRRSAEFILLSSLNDKRAGFVLEILEGIRKRILSFVGWSKKDEPPGLYAVLLFADSSDYLQYVSAFGEEGEDELSVGIFLPQAYGHMAIVEQEIWRMEATLAYILVQYMLEPLDLPTWLREGISLHFAELYDQGEKMVELRSSERRAEERRTFWSQNSLSGFWSGSDFSDPSVREKAEDLALCLTRLVLGRAKSVKTLLESVNWSDAGFEAVRQHTPQELSDLVSELLGEGNWTLESASTPKSTKHSRSPE